MKKFDLLCWCSVILLAACEAREPLYVTDADLGDAAQRLPPTDLQLSYDDRLDLGTVQDPDFSHLKPAPEPQPEVDPQADGDLADDAAAGGMHPEVGALVARYNAGMAKPDHQAVVALYEAVYRPLVEQNFVLLDKLMSIVETIGDASPMTAMMKPMLEGGARIRLTSTETRGDDTVLAGIAFGSPMIPPQQWIFKRGQQDAWFIVGQQGTSPEKVEPLLALLKTSNEDMDAILQGLEDGSLDTQQAVGQFQQAAMKMGSQVMQILQKPAPPADAPDDASDSE